MRVRGPFVLGIAAVAAGAVLWVARGRDPVVVQTGENASSSRDDSPPGSRPSVSAAAADGQRTALAPPLNDTVPTDACLCIEVVFAANQEPAVDAAVFVLPTSDRERDPAADAESCGRTGHDGVLRVTKPTASVYVSARHGPTYAQKFVAAGKATVRLELREDDAIAVRVIDSAGNPLAGVKLVLTNEKATQLLRAADATGHAVFPHVQQYGRRDELHVGAAIPGRYVTAPAPLREAERPFDLSLGDVGMLALHSRGCDDARVQVCLAGLEPIGGAATPRLVGGRGEVVVAASARFRVMASCGGQSATLPDIAGPVANGDRVEVELPLEHCRVRGRFTVRPEGKARCLMIGPDDLFAAEVTVAADGAFELPVPRWPVPPAILAFATERTCCECADARIDAAECDLGILELAPRPVIGIVDVAVPTGWGTARNVNATHRIVLRGGRQAQGSFVTGLLVPKFDLPDHGVEVLGLPSIASVTASARGDGLFAEPASVELRDGARQRIVLAEGGAAVVHLSAPDERGLLPLRLRPSGGGALVDRRSGTREPGGQRDEFAELRPGEYTVEVEGRSVVGTPFLVLAGDRAEVRVSLQPR